MNIEFCEKDGAAMAVLSGEIDGKTAPEAQSKLLPFLGDHKSLVLDVSAVTFMSSAGLRLMLLLYRHATAAGGKVALVGLCEQIRDTMSATGFLDFFKVCDSHEAAVLAIKE